MSFPVLRFKDFSDNWLQLSLEVISEKIQDGTHFSPEASETGDFKYLTSKNVKNGYIDLSNVSYISEKSHREIYKRCDIRKGDVLITKDGTIGQVCVNTLSEEFSLLSSVAFIRTKESFNNYFLYHLLLSPKGQGEIIKSIAGQALQRITLTKLNNYIYFFPSYSEQTKIANFLTAVDEKITQLTQKCDLLAQYKKGVMQQIFSQELRFKDDDGRDFPDWEEVPIVKCLELMTDFVSNGSFESLKERVTVFDSEQYAYYVRLYDLRLGVGHGKQAYVDEKSYRFLKKSFIKAGDILIANIGANVGEVWQVPLLDKPATIAPNMILLKVHSSINESCLFYFLRSEEGNKEISNTVSGSGQPKINKTDLKKIIVKIPPSYLEQTKIANFLTAIDDKISNAQAQLAAVKQYKKGLLQQMFV